VATGDTNHNHDPEVKKSINEGLCSPSALLTLRSTSAKTVIFSQNYSRSDTLPKVYSLKLLDQDL